MLNTLLVDDEPGAIKALKYLLEWESFGFTVSGEAANGHMALELLKSNPYDLIITDIRMPGISGLEFIAAIREESDVPIVVVSGFDEFEYVRKCMKHSVKDYLLKPVNEEDVVKLLTQIRQEIDQRAKLDKQLYHGVPAMKDQILKAWAHGSMDTAHVLEQLGLLNIDFAGQQAFCCMLLEMDFQETQNTNMTEKNIHTLRFAVRNVVEETLGRRGYVFEESKERFGIIIYRAGSGQGHEYAERIAAEIRESVLMFAKIPVTIGIGETVYDMKDVVQSFYSANMILDRKVVCDMQKQRNAQQSGAIDQVKSIVAQEYASNVSLKSIGEQIYMNPVYLGHLFKSTVGISFNDYLMQVRMEHAKSELIHSSKKIYVIAGEVGYRQLDWFYKKFKEYTGLSASEFRAKYAPQ